MDTSENPTDTNENAAGAESDSAAATSGSVIAAARQLQQAMSRFAQEDEAGQQGVVALIQNSSGQTNEGNAGAQIAQAEPDFSPLREAAQQLQASVSRFAQEHDKGDEGITSVVSQIGAQLRNTDAKTEQNTAQIEKLGNWIRNNRR